MTLRDRIDARFGADLFARPLFYSREVALRFGLSDGDTWIAQMLSAMRTGSAIARDAFSGSASFVACLRESVSGSGFSIRPQLQGLYDAQVPVPRKRDVWVEDAVRHDDDLDDVPQRVVTLAFDVPADRLDNVLWCAFAQDLGIRPRVTCAVYLLDFRSGVALFPYDDRGMDVVGPREALQALYDTHRDTVLEYDAARMARVFGG